MRHNWIFTLLAIISILIFASCDTDEDDDSEDDDDDAGDDDTAGDDDDDTAEDCQALDCVDVFIGSGGTLFGIGQNNPAATLPAGFAKVGPDTSQAGLTIGPYHCSGYYYPDNHIRMFSHVHIFGMGAPDYGGIGMMPITWPIGDKVTEETYRQTLDHDSETASPGYYAVTLPESGVRAEMTTALWTAYHRQTFPDTEIKTIVFDMEHMGANSHGTTDAWLNIDPENSEVNGFAVLQGSLSGRTGGTPVYFVTKFQTPFAEYGIYQDTIAQQGETAGVGEELGGWVTWTAKGSEVIEFKIGLSVQSLNKARANLEAEIPGWDLEEVKTAAEDAWKPLLDKVIVTGGSSEEREKFYTALYHVFIHPTSFTETDGTYLGFDRQSHLADGFIYYTDFSLWDTFRTVHPLLDLIAPDMQSDMLASMTRMYIEGGGIPKWAIGAGYGGSMIGTSADPVFAGSYLKGIRGFDIEKAYEGLRAHAVGPFSPAGRGGIEDYLNLGYVAADHHGGSVSRTLEFCYDDFALSRLADALGKDEDAAMFFEHSQYYRNLFNPATGFLQGRNADGSWKMLIPLWPHDYYTEGNAWHYLFYVPHDPYGLAELFGGWEATLAKLDEFFVNATRITSNSLPGLWYFHGNEPDIHASYMYSMYNRPDKTAYWVNWIRQTRYGTGPDGLVGNDDLGTLSAWYVMSALGIFSIAGDDLYVIGSPVFEKAEVDMGGKTLTIIAENVSPENIYVQWVNLNGEPLTKPYFRHADIAGGGELYFLMGPSPSGWGMQ